MDQGRVVAITSYEGSAGRTLIALGLYETALMKKAQDFVLACFDIEKPDILRHFMQTRFIAKEYYSQIPSIDKSQCRFCGWCVQFCSRNAIHFNRTEPSISVDSQYCEACGECLPSCNRKVLSTKEQLLGYVLQARQNGLSILAGKADEQQDFLLPLVNHLNEHLSVANNTIVDMPPGVSPLVSISLREATHAVIAVKPSLGWKRNVKQVIELLQARQLPFRILINKYRGETAFLDEVQTYCRDNKYLPPFVIPYFESLDTGKGKLKIAMDNNALSVFSELWNLLFLPPENSTESIEST